MLYKKNIDFDHVYDHMGFTLGKFIHDDSDGFEKWDWSVYQFAVEKTWDEGYRTEEYDFVKSLDISPYERNMNLIKEKFHEWVDKYYKLEYGLEQTL